VARGNLRALGVSNVDLVVGNIAGLPLEDGSVDAAFANMVVHHAEDPAPMLREMARITTPGGTVAIVDEVETPTNGYATSTPTSGWGSARGRSRVSSARRA
jgi:ubiquinone/menaquinone biosynthesis C-methylase UbiE